MSDDNPPCSSKSTLKRKATSSTCPVKSPCPRKSPFPRKSRLYKPKETLDGFLEDCCVSYCKKCQKEVLAYNELLKKQSFRLIELGFSPDIKEFLQRLWIIYLKYAGKSTSLNELRLLDSPIQNLLQAGEPSTSSTGSKHHLTIFLTLPKVLALVCIALHASDEDYILPSDLLRWVYQGKFPYFESSKKTQHRKIILCRKMNLKIPPLEVTLTNVYEDMNTICRMIKHELYPYKETYRISRRFLCDLNLPCQTANFVINLIKRLEAMSLQSSEAEFMKSMKIETFVLSCVLISIKLLFILDDHSERIKSTLAEALNEDEETKIKNFVFDTWFAWLKQVNRILSTFLIYPNKDGHVPELISEDALWDISQNCKPPKHKSLFSSSLHRPTVIMPTGKKTLSRKVNRNIAKNKMSLFISNLKVLPGIPDHLKKCFGKEHDFRNLVLMEDEHELEEDEHGLEEYWHIHDKRKSHSIVKDLPQVFQEILNYCSKMISLSPEEIYSDLIKIEKIVFSPEIVP